MLKYDKHDGIIKNYNTDCHINSIIKYIFLGKKINI